VPVRDQPIHGQPVHDQKIHEQDAPHDHAKTNCAKKALERLTTNVSEHEMSLQKFDWGQIESNSNLTKTVVLWNCLFAMNPFPRESPHVVH